MKQIFVLGGIVEARQLCERLCGAFAVTLSVATAYGAELAADGGFRVLCGKRDAAGFTELFRKERTDLAVDCSHPFAEAASREFAAACKAAEVPLFCYRREETLCGDDVVKVYSFTEAAEAAKRLSQGKTVFFAAGVNHLPELLQVLPAEQVAVRALDRTESLERLKSLGIPEENVVAKQGPFSEEENAADFAGHHTGVLITKDSGIAGGTTQKLKAAKRLGIPAVMVSPPPPAGGQVFRSIETLYREIAAYFC